MRRMQKTRLGMPPEENQPRLRGFTPLPPLSELQWEQLANDRPDAFGAKLALSTSVLRNCLRAGGKHEPAAEAAGKGLAQLKPHFLALPQAHAGLMKTLVSNYMESVERAHTKPDMTLLAPVLEILQKSQ